MSTEQNQEVPVTPEATEGEGTESETETIAVAKKDYDKLNQSLGSLKRELKDLQKAQVAKETPQPTKTDESVLEQKIEKMALRSAGITHEDDVDLARKTAKKWNMDIDDVLHDDDFKVKLERQQTSRANLDATSNIRGSASTSQAKNTPAYWIAKGVPPTAADVPDRKVRATIARAMMDSTKNSKKFYND